MRRRAATAALGAVALFAGFGLTYFGGQDRTPAGHRESSQTILAASVPSPSDRLLESLSLREAERLETERLEAERLERVAQEERVAKEALEAEEREVARVAAATAERARKAAQAVSVTPTTVRAAPVARTPVTPAPASTGGGGEWAIPTYIVMCESGGNWHAQNASGAAGPYQLMPMHFGGDSALNQSREAQHAKAAELWAGGAGKRNWAECL